MISFSVLHLRHKVALERMHVNDASNLVHIIDFQMRKLKVALYNLFDALVFHYIVTSRFHLKRLFVFCLLGGSLTCYCCRSYCLFSGVELPTESFRFGDNSLIFCALFLWDDTEFILVTLFQLLVEAIDVESTVDFVHDQAPWRLCAASLVHFSALSLHNTSEFVPGFWHLTHFFV